VTNLFRRVAERIVADLPPAPCLANFISPERLIAGRCFLMESEAFGGAAAFLVGVLLIKQWYVNIKCVMVYINMNSYFAPRAFAETIGVGPKLMLILPLCIL
jgi:hypothetical protein